VRAATAAPTPRRQPSALSKEATSCEIVSSSCAVVVVARTVAAGLREVRGDDSDASEGYISQRRECVGEGEGEDMIEVSREGVVLDPGLRLL